MKGALAVLNAFVALTGVSQRAGRGPGMSAWNRRPLYYDTQQGYASQPPSYTRPSSEWNRTDSYGVPSWQSSGGHQLPWTRQPANPPPATAYTQSAPMPSYAAGTRRYPTGGQGSNTAQPTQLGDLSGSRRRWSTPFGSSGQTYQPPEANGHTRPVRPSGSAAGSEAGSAAGSLTSSATSQPGQAGYHAVGDSQRLQAGSTGQVAAQIPGYAAGQARVSQPTQTASEQEDPAHIAPREPRGSTRGTVVYSDGSTGRVYPGNQQPGRPLTRPTTPRPTTHVRNPIDGDSWEPGYPANYDPFADPIASDYPGSPFHDYAYTTDAFSSAYSTHSFFENYGTEYSNRYYHNEELPPRVEWPVAGHSAEAPDAYARGPPEGLMQQVAVRPVGHL